MTTPWPGLLLALTLLSSCGGGGSDLCARYAAARCARLSACDELIGLFADETTCEQRLRLSCNGELGAPQTGATPSGLERCTDALAGLACDQLDGDACATAAGKLPIGSQCRYHSQCVSAHCTVPRRAACGVCEPPPQVGDSCDVDCAPLACDPIAFSCAMAVAAGAACGVGRPCAAGLSCFVGDGGSDGTCQPATSSSVCGDGTACMTPAADGQACNALTGPPCLFPSHCLLDGTVRGGGICTPPDAKLCASGVPPNPGPPAGPFTPAAHDASFVVPNQSGPILTAPDLVTITWSDYPLADEVHAFGNWIVGSDWLAAVGKDYGVGFGTNVDVRLPSPAPTMLYDSDLQKQIVAWQADGTVPPAGINTIYMVYLNPGMQFSDVYGQTACVDYGAFHAEGGQPFFAYAPIGTCPIGGVWDLLSQTEISAAHEFIEAATDPRPTSAPAYKVPNAFNEAAEVADLCDGRNDREGSFAYQRIWSNTAAATGGDPCLPPNPKEPYFRVELSQAGIIPVTIGVTTELTFRAWSSAPTGELGVNLQASGSFVPSLVDPRTKATLDLTYGLVATIPDAPVMTNGGLGHLTVTPGATARDGELSTLIIEARSSYDVYTDWPVLVQAHSQ